MPEMGVPLSAARWPVTALAVEPPLRDLLEARQTRRSDVSAASLGDLDLGVLLLGGAKGFELPLDLDPVSVADVDLILFYSASSESSGSPWLSLPFGCGTTLRSNRPLMRSPSATTGSHGSNLRKVDARAREQGRPSLNGAVSTLGERSDTARIDSADPSTRP